MNILIVAATEFEVKPLLNFLEIKVPIIGMNTVSKDFKELDVNVLITGIGMVSTAFMMGQHLINNNDLVINAGVCGAFDKDLKLGQLVNITEDIISEMGAEDGDDFITYNKLELEGTHIFKNTYNKTVESINKLKKVKGITVNTIHGNEASIEKIKKRYNPNVESMEGAAFFACSSNIDEYIQIRAISNYVERRDKSKWNMPLAIKNLNEFLIEKIIKKIN